jgi:hypothetical protein
MAREQRPTNQGADAAARWQHPGRTVRVWKSLIHQAEGNQPPQPRDLDPKEETE